MSEGYVCCSGCAELRAAIADLRERLEKIRAIAQRRLESAPVGMNPGMTEILAELGKEGK